MSLVGSLEDLGLGDILQIVSLSRKSGLLLLRSDHGDGRILFCDGLIRAAYVKGEAEDLEALLVQERFAQPDEVSQARERARHSARDLEEVVREQLGLSVERLDSLRREHVERVVLRMFGWRAGEFSFEVRDEIEPRDAPLALASGINAQYLTMEATRLGDEASDAALRPPESSDDSLAEEPEADFMFSGEASAPGPAPDGAPGALALATVARQVQEPEQDAGPAPAPGPAVRPEAAPEPEVAPEPQSEIEAVAEPDVASEVEAAPGPELRPEVAPGRGLEAKAEAGGRPEPAVARETEAPPRGEASAQDSSPALALIVIDPELRALEWLKSTLSGLFQRVHIFQRSETGLERIRQYLRRGEIPAVLVSPRVPSDPASGAVDTASLLRRLRAQAPRMPLLLIHDGSNATLPAAQHADAVVQRPTLGMLADRRRRDEVDAAAEALCSALTLWGRGPAASAEGAGDIDRSDPRAHLDRLGQLSTRLRDPSSRGDVLNLVLDFAAEIFRRVAVFMVRDDVAVGLAQRRLALAGGPAEPDFQGVSLPVAECRWLRCVLESREALQAPPADAGDRRLAALLGERPPPEAFLAPIESGGRVAAVLYADNLPDGGPLGDTTVLAIVLHEAGLALDRALLERALERAERGEEPSV
jgi:hypothetical protein